MAKRRKLKGKALAAARRNIKKARAAMKRKSSPKRRRSTRKRSAPRRKATRRKSTKTTKRKKKSKKSMVGKIPFINNPTVKKIAVGIGTATLAVTVLGFVAPQIAANPIVRPAIAFLAGGPIAAGVQFLTQGGIAAIGGGGASGGGGNA